MFEVHISFSRPNGIFTFFTAPLAAVEIEATLGKRTEVNFISNVYIRHTWGRNMGLNRA